MKRNLNISEVLGFLFDTVGEGVYIQITFE
jgi:hypothetical protein